MRPAHDEYTILNKYFRYALLLLLWGAVVAYVIYAAASARSVHVAKKIQRVDIEVVDSSSLGCLVSGMQVREWIRRSGIKTVGAPVGKAQLAAIESLIAKNGFVERVVAYTTYDDVLHIEISQRKPLLRLLTDGRDAYVTDQGYVFVTPKASSLYVPVVSGSYRPPFPVDYSDFAGAYLLREKGVIDKKIEELEADKYPLFERELKNDRNIAALRRMRIKRQWWRLESKDVFAKRVDQLRNYKADMRRKYRYEEHLIQQGIDRLSQQQAVQQAKQKKLQKSYEDFAKLLIFVKFVEEDDFWRSEVVQIAARTTSSGALEVELVPRSGGFTILFGRIEQIERKFDKLLRFYRVGLPNIGWNTYRSIDVRFGDQIICKR